MASRRALSARRFHRHQPVAPSRAGRRLLQQARDVRTMDQGRQGRDQVDTAVVQDVRGQRRAAPASCDRLQSWQLSPHACNTGADRGLVADELEGKLISAKVVSHGRYVVFQMAEVAIPRQMFQEILRRGTTAAATTRASMKRLIVTRVEAQSTGGMRPDASENSQIS